MIRIKKPEEIAILREGGAILARLHDELAALVVPGVSTDDINDEALSRMEQYGVEPVLLGYHPRFAPRPYPAALCVSVNDVVEHGIPNEHPIILKDGDVVGLDITIGYKGLIVDSGRTMPVGLIAPEVQKLINITKEALHIGIKAARPGGRIGDIGAAIEEFVKPHGYGIVEELCGHGVGYAVHEEPNVPNVGRRGTGEEIEPGLVLAIEPMLNLGTKDVIFDEEDGYTVRTADGLPSAHFEHTIAILESGPEILTVRR